MKLQKTIDTENLVQVDGHYWEPGCVQVPDYTYKYIEKLEARVKELESKLKAAEPAVKLVTRLRAYNANGVKEYCPDHRPARPDECGCTEHLDHIRTGRK